MPPKVLSNFWGHIIYLWDTNVSISECKAKPESDRVQYILLIGHYIALVRCKTVVQCKVETNAVWPWVPVETDLWRHVEAQLVLALHEYVIIVVEFRVACTEFHTYVWLEVGLDKTVADERTERKREHLVLLVSVHG